MNSILPNKVEPDSFAQLPTISEGAVDVGCTRVSRSVEISRMRAALIGQRCRRHSAKDTRLAACCWYCCMRITSLIKFHNRVGVCADFESDGLS